MEQPLQLINVSLTGKSILISQLIGHSFLFLWLTFCGIPAYFDVYEIRSFFPENITGILTK
jgi:hypothetical protein